MPSRSAPAAAVPSTSSGSSNAQLGLLAACLILSGTSAYFYVTCSSSVSPIGGAGSDRNEAIVAIMGKQWHIRSF